MNPPKESVSFVVDDVLATNKTANVVAKSIKGKSVCIELVGDVGAGKTTFTQALVSALGSRDNVTSPSFTLENVYHAEPNIIHHFDLYRLQEAGLIPEEVQEALKEPKAIVIIEWADLLIEGDQLPDERIIILFEPIASSETTRKITISAPAELEISKLISKRDII